MKYITLPPKAEWDDHELIMPTQTVHESEPQPTGLLNHKGERLFRVTGPIGFDPSRIYRPTKRKRK